MSLNQILDYVADDLSEIESAILHHIQTDIPILTNVAEHILAAGGKRLRPALVLLGAKLFGYDGKETIRAAQIIEYLHTATLLHDDVVDNADMRRSQKTACRIWGNEASVLVGDYLFSMVFYMLTELKNLEVLKTMSDTTTLMAKGELLQLTHSHESMDEDKYLEIIFNKTACLFASALKIGAIIANAPDESQQKLYDYGMAIGLAFQVVDDALDYMEEESKTGKSIGIDLQERKITLPLIHLLNSASPEDKARVNSILAAEIITDEHVHEVIQMMKFYDSTMYAVRVAQKYTNDAQIYLKALPASPIKQMLNDIANFIVIRHF
ncbi:MAG: polyprenyl synthetase family protein [SAR324 cluster bacterium]|nr:polyprenyl synthetase family protein [SAR324 cluster bacterium]